jgi:hypothetical protein
MRNPFHKGGTPSFDGRGEPFASAGANRLAPHVPHHYDFRGGEEQISGLFSDFGPTLPGRIWTRFIRYWYTLWFWSGSSLRT